MSDINPEGPEGPDGDNTPLVSVSRYAAAQADLEEIIGERVGAYRIVGELGRGGMGAVYLAERADSEFRRRVAVKVVKRGMDTDSILRRFRNERQILAALDHPNIARLLDGGTTTDGRPYFVMEYINGAPITQYCDARRLGIGERLRLFQQVCAALSYAHQNLVIHRDVKPSNILVTTDGTPKLLDFGIAKLLNPELAHDTLAPTTLSVRPMTPEYASPEQIKGEPVTPASDQYSLGVLLYELLTGNRPYHARNGAFLEVARVICEETPERPSKLVTLARDATTANDDEAKTSITLHAICESRGVTPDALRRELESGLDNIIMLALRKEPTERYPSVADLSADITRFLNGQPVVAPPPAARPAIKTNAVGWRERRVTLLLLAALILCAAAGFAAYRFLKSRPRSDANAARVAIPSPNMNVKRLTTTGTERLPVISPDGQFIAHISFESGGQSLSLMQLRGGATRQVVAPAEVLYLGLAFSPDSNYLYYTRTNRTTIEGQLFRVAVSGGEPERVLEPVSNAIGFAPDGKRFAYVHVTESTGENRLALANTDGSGSPQVLASHSLFNFFNSNLAWSPDGKLIAYAMGDFSTAGFAFKLAAVNLSTGAESVITPRGFADLTQVAWLNDGSGLVITARDTLSSPMQLWYVAYPTGELRRITNDLNNYDGVSLTADNSMLITSKRDDQSNLFTVELSNAAASQGPMSKRMVVNQITTGVERQDGITGLRWTADGRILYVASASDGTDIYLMDADGSRRQRLTRDMGLPDSPSLTPDGRYLVFAAYRDDQFSVWRLDVASGAVTKLTANMAFFPTLTPDGRSVIHTQVVESGKSPLHRTSIDGGAATPLASFNARRPVISPDGRWIACNFNNDRGGEWQIAVVAITGGEPAHVLQLPGFPDSQAPPERPLAWTADSRALLYINDAGNGANIWLAPLDGGPHQQLTRFTEGRIFNFARSTDGRRLVLARGSTATDIVLFRNFR
jgi:serine/threonine protein kinase/Tol biopolymer transport system component